MAQVNFTASVDKNPVAENDRFRLQLTIENAQGSITPPDLSDFNLIFGPAKSTNVQLINGQMSSTMTFTYTLTPKSKGTFTIGPATAKTDEGTFQSEAISLKVVEGSSANNRRQGSSGSAPQSQGDDNLMAEIRLDKSTVYKGEQVVLTYYIYSRYRNIDFTDYNFPATNGFYSHDFKEEQAGWLNNYQRVNGKQYRVAVLKRQILFPQQHGTLEIDPMVVTARVDYSFFNPGRTIKVKSNKIELKVLPLPNPPAGFAGDVGRFDFELEADRTTLKANDAITLRAKVSGRGNLKLVNAPDIPFPKDFEVYDPKTTDRFSTSSGALTGSREFEYLIIPRHAGVYKIEPVKYVYFDPVAKQYKTITSDPMEITVERAEGEGSGITYSGSNKEDVIILDQDIRYIKPAEPLSERSGYFFRSGFFYGLLFIGPLALLVFVIARRRYIRQQSDVVSVRSRRAGKMARKLLSEANKKLKANEREGFYDAVFKAMYGFLSGKLNIDAAELNRDKIRAALSEQGIDEQLIETLMDLLSRCEMARFAPSSELQPEEDYQSAAQLIGALQKRLST